MITDINTWLNQHKDNIFRWQSGVRRMPYVPTASMSDGKRVSDVIFDEYARSQGWYDDEELDLLSIYRADQRRTLGSPSSIPQREAQYSERLKDLFRQFRRDWIRSYLGIWDPLWEISLQEESDSSFPELRMSFDELMG